MDVRLSYSRSTWQTHEGYDHRRQCSLRAVVRYRNEWAAAYVSPWVSGPAVAQPLDEIYKLLLRNYGRATVGGAIVSARNKLTAAVKQRLKTGEIP